MLLLHQSHWHIRIFISHQSYNNIGISRSKYSVGVLFSFHWIHGVKNDINLKLWAHFVIVMVGSLSECLIVLVKDMLGLERVAGNFFVSFLSWNIGFLWLLYSQCIRQKTYIPSGTMTTIPKIQTEYTQSLHCMSIRQFWFYLCWRNSSKCSLLCICCLVMHRALSPMGRERIV